MDDRNLPVRERMSDVEFVRKTLILIGIVIVVLILWVLSDVLLLAFGAILVAIILHTVADVLARYLRVPTRWSLALAALVIFAFFVGLAFLFGSNIRNQFSAVAEQLPLALDAFGQKLGIGQISDNLSDLISQIPSSGFAQRIAGIGGIVLGGLTDFVLVVISGLYIAASPRLYYKGFVKLFPVGQHERIEDALVACGQALKLWLLGQFIAMIGVGILSTLAFWIIGLPSPYALGLIAGVLDFIPFLGPILGALPAVLISFTLGSEAVVWTVIAMLVIQQIEGNLIQPIAQRKMVDIPPALALFGIVIGGVVFGTVGLMLGFPLVVVIYVLVKKLYVREVLGEATPVPGETKSKEKTPAPAAESL
ncbi:AI-2E family transporter [Microvirga rosea]|uniref:AI-2E family transporter n=1 Tax=Microvirga rosea TaxID=2715425 RepID=UPI001D09F6B0|nr:AI-2E family transporter [Microvirga rosea]MCB8820077.1 AI-2E family transporter [Microvirga rosea]